VDHIGGNAALKRAGRAQLLIHREDAAFLEDQGRCFDQLYAPLYKAIMGERGLPGAKDAFLKDMAPELVVDKKLEDEDLVDLGEGVEIRVLHLPGHSAGSVGYYWEKEEILFSGDSLPGLGSPDGTLPIIYDLEAYGRSLDRLKEAPIRAILSTHAFRGLHSAPSTVRKGSEVREFLRDCRETGLSISESIHIEASRNPDRPLVEFTDAVIDGLPGVLGFKRTGEARVPQFTLGTVFWGIEHMKCRGQG
jgi:glyoxylase-like metal-dependent hydrolase (beta-lactamase superfamily II)